MLVVISWLKDKGYDVVVCGIDVGEGKDMDVIKEKVLKLGVVLLYMIDVK